MAANSYRNVFLTNLATIPSSGTTLDLGIGELGIVNTKTNTLTSSPNFPSVRSIQIVQGNTDRKLPKGFAWGNQTWRTPEIPASPDIKFEVLPAQKAQNMIVTLGYDGVDTSKTMTPRKGKDVELYITLTGQPIANLVGNTGNHPASITETFYLQLPCVDECTTNCGDTVDCNAVADAVIKQVSERKTIGGIQLVDGVNGEQGLLKLTKLLSCETSSGLPTVACEKFELVVADLGDQSALGAVEAQYPGYTTTRTKRDGIYSYYSQVRCDETTPSAFVPTQSVIAVDCACPSGWSSTDAYNVYTIVRAGNVTAGTITSAYTSVIEGTATKLSFDGSKSTFQILSSDDLATVAAVVSTDIVEQVSSTAHICTAPQGTSIPWSNTGESCAKAQKLYQISLKNDTCDGDCSTLLADLQAVYGDGVTLVTSNTDTCMCLFQLTVDSENECVNCADIDSQYFTFKKPQAFGTSLWTEVAGQSSVYGTNCVCGVRFESAYVARDRKECFFEDVSYEVEPLFIYVSTQNPDFRDYSTLCNDDEVFPVTLIQTAKYRQGYGSYVADQVKLSKFYFNEPWFHEPAVRDAVGYELGVDLQGYYDEYTLTWKKPIEFGSNFSGFGLSQFEEYEWKFFLPQGQGTSFKNAVNSWLASVNAQTI